MIPAHLRGGGRSSSTRQTKVREACGVLADALYGSREPRITPVAFGPVPDIAVVDVQVWLAGVADDPARLGAKAT